MISAQVLKRQSDGIEKTPNGGLTANGVSKNNMRVLSITDNIRCPSIYQWAFKIKLRLILAFQIVEAAYWERSGSADFSRH